MSTTTIRMPDELKTRVAAAAKRAGTTPHGFILEAIAESHAGRVAWRFRNHGGCPPRRDSCHRQDHPWASMRDYLEARLAGTPARRPSARKLAR